VSGIAALVGAACIVERGSWPAGFARSGRLAALEEAARRTALRTVDVSLRSRRGGLYRGAGLLARWLRDFARSGRLAALEEAARRTAPRTHVLHCLASLEKAAFIVERGSWPAGRATSRGVDVSLRSWRRPGGPPHVAPRTVPYVQCPTYSALRTVPYVQ